jgi:choline dehydrogenase-like flavoprotein
VKYRPSDAVDFLVIGAGAAGGVMAKELAVAGARVVVLEQGPYLHERDYSHDEIKYTIQPGLTNDPKTQPNLHRKTVKDAFKPMKAIEYGRQVGGGTVHFTGKLLALSRERFSRAQPVWRDPRYRFRRLAAALLRPGTVLHESRVRSRHLRTGGREPVRSAAIQAVPATAHAGGIFGRDL